MKKKIILASSSPRRKKILDDLNLDFEVIPSDYDESLESIDFDYKKIEELAYQKAKSVFDSLFPFTSNHFLILSADTVVILDKKILGKPRDKEDAISMLHSLSGRKHSVVTSLCLIDTETRNKNILSTTSFVEFNILSKEQIKNYVEQYKPFDKAGSYGIQELPEGFVKSLQGSLENVIGLCPLAVQEILADFL